MVVLSTVFFSCGFFTFAQIKKRWVFWYGELWIRSIAIITGLKIKTIGFDRINWHKPCVFAANHSSYLDIAIVMISLPVRFYFLTKKSLFYVPLFGWSLYTLDHISIDRSTTEKAYESICSAAKRIANGQHVLVFPEGGISRQRGIRPFKKGAFSMALQAGVPVVPVCVRNSRKLLDIYSKTLMPNGLNVEIEIFEAIKPKDGPEAKLQILRETQAIIAEHYQ